MARTSQNTVDEISQKGTIFHFMGWVGSHNSSQGALLLERKRSKRRKNKHTWNGKIRQQFFCTITTDIRIIRQVSTIKSNINNAQNERKRENPNR